jgi:hypothetical protein
VATEFSTDAKTLSILSSERIARSLDLQTKALTKAVAICETEYPLGLSEDGRYLVGIDDFGDSRQPVPSTRAIRVRDILARRA